MSLNHSVVARLNARLTWEKARMFRRVTLLLISIALVALGNVSAPGSAAVTTTTGLSAGHATSQPHLGRLRRTAMDLSAQRREHLNALSDATPLPEQSYPQVARAVPPPTGTATITNPARTHDIFNVYNSTTPNAVIPANDKSTTDETSGAMRGPVRFMTGNWYAAFSNNSGSSWNYVNPFTSFSGQTTDGGFCCDQSAIYDPSRDMNLWLLQYQKSSATSSGRNRLRLAVYRNASAGIKYSGWITYGLFPSQYGGTSSGEWFDYPHMALSNNYLYITVNVFSTTVNPSTGREDFRRSVIIRISLASLASGSALSNSYYTGSSTFTPVQGAGAVMYWANHASNTSMNIYRWPESGNATVVSRTVPAWNRTTKGQSSCPTGDGQDWCVKSDDRVLAGVRTYNAGLSQYEIWFFWNVRHGSGFPWPYLNAARFRQSDLAYLSRPLLWSETSPFQWGAAAVNSRGNTGLAVFQGLGTGLYPSLVLCIDDAFNALPAPWECRSARSGTNGPFDNGWGDYLAVRPSYPRALGWMATGWTLRGGKTREFIEPRMVVFGRSGDSPG